MSSFFYYVNPKSSTEERATHTHTHRLTTSPEKAQNKRLSPKIIPKVPPSKLSKTMSTILLTDNTEKKKKKHHQYRCKNTTVDQKALNLCVCVYMWVYVCTSLPWPKLARSSFFLSQQPLYRRIRDCPNTYTFLTKEKPNYSSPNPPPHKKKERKDLPPPPLPSPPPLHLLLLPMSLFTLPKSKKKKKKFNPLHSSPTSPLSHPVRPETDTLKKSQGAS